MAATAEQIARLRRMAAEPTLDVYSDDVLADYIERYPLLDERGQVPYTWDTTATPPAQEANTAWVATYDLHAAAADVWEEKAASYAGKYDFGADGATYHLSQQYDQMIAQARFHRARRSPSSAKLVQWPEESAAGDFSWIGNLPEEA